MTKNPNLEDVRARRREIATLLEPLAAEARELEMVERVLARMASTSVASYAEMPVLVPIVSRHFNKIGGKTKNTLILESLSGSRPLWQTANQIQEFVAKASGKEAKMSSISPALWALKKEGKIVRKDLLVADAARVGNEEPGFFNENGEAKASPETGEASGLSNR